MLKFIFSRNFFKDRTILLLFAAATILLIIEVGIVALNMSSRSYPVPVRYSAYTVGEINRDKWYNLFVFPAFCAVAYFVNIILAAKVFELRRPLALGMLSLSIIVGIFGVLVTNAIFDLL